MMVKEFLFELEPLVLVTSYDSLKEELFVFVITSLEALVPMVAANQRSPMFQLPLVEVLGRAIIIALPNPNLIDACLHYAKSPMTQTSAVSLEAASNACAKGT